MLTKILGCTWEVETEIEKILHNAELHNTYSSPDTVGMRREICAGHTGDVTNAFRILVGKSGKVEDHLNI
jgi:hypothetical protein